MSPCWSATPAQSPAPGSRPGGAVAGTTRAWPFCWPATTRSINICGGTRDYFFAVAGTRGRRSRESLCAGQPSASRPPSNCRWRSRRGAIRPLAMPIAGVLCDGGQLSARWQASTSFRRSEPGGADQFAAHERQHVQHRAAWQRLLTRSPGEPDVFHSRSATAVRDETHERGGSDWVDAPASITR